MKFLQRAGWSTGAAPTKVVPHPITSKGQGVDLVVLHHSVTGQSPSMDRARAIEAYHQRDGSEFFDIAYNYLVAVDGTAFEARGPYTQGGATGAGQDKLSLSVCAIGNFETSHPPIMLLDTIGELLSDLVKTGLVKPGFKLQPHSDFKATACCGAHLKTAIPSIMSRVGSTPKAMPAVAPPATYSSEQKLRWIEQILAM